jgi:hypothetical protein
MWRHFIVSFRWRYRESKSGCIILQNLIDSQVSILVDMRNQAITGNPYQVTGREGIFTKEELLVMMRVVDQEMKRKRREKHIHNQT